jgi:hypothetical protein
VSLRSITVAGAVMFAAGIVTLVAASSTAASAVGLALACFGGVVLALLAFYMVGRSEDEDRARRG